MPLPPLPPSSTPGTQATGMDIIRRAMRLIGVKGTGEVPDADEAQDALVSLNVMIDSWNTERLMIFDVAINDFPLTPGQQTYTLGTGGNFNLARPARIERMSIVQVLNTNQPLELPIEMQTDAMWQAIPVKNVSGTLPLKCYDDGAFPFRNLSFWTIPTIAVTARIYSWSSIQQFTDLTSLYSFPPGYFKALAYCLAVELAPEFGLEISQTVATQAILAKANVESQNTTIVDIQCDPAVSNTNNGVFNYYTGDFQRP